MALWRRPGLRIAAVVFLVVFVAHAGRQYWRIARTPSEPIREGMDLLGKIAPADARVAMLSIGARSTLFAYGNMAPQTLTSVHNVDDWRKEEGDAGVFKWAVVTFAGFLPLDEPDVWEYLESHYTLRKSLPGRISNFDIYERTR